MNTLPDPKFGSELYRLRTARGKAQVTVADQAGLARGYYSQLENSRKAPPPGTTVIRIAQALELSEDDSARLTLLANCERFAIEAIGAGVSNPIGQLMLELVLNASRISNAQLEEIRTILKG